jgi:hypothetical protein
MMQHFKLQNGLDACLYTAEAAETRITRLIETFVNQTTRYTQTKRPYGITINTCYLIEIKLQYEEVYLIYIWKDRQRRTSWFLNWQPSVNEIISSLTNNLRREIRNIQYVAYGETLYALYQRVAYKIKDAVVNGTPVGITALLED